MIDGAVHLRRADLDEAFEPIALHQLLGEPSQRHRVRLEEAPGVLPGDRSLALRGEVDDDLRFLAVEKLEQKVEFVRYVTRMVLVTGALVDTEREGGRAERVAPDAEHLRGFGVIE